MKAKQQKSPQLPADSLLARAWEAFERGDMVAARAHAEKVLGAEPPTEELAAARVIGERLGLPNPTPRDVAKAFVQKTYPPPRVYLFAAAIVVIFAGLLLFATLAYHH